MRGQSWSEFQYGSYFWFTSYSNNNILENFVWEFRTRNLPETSTGLRWSHVLENRTHTQSHTGYISMELDKLEIRYIVHGHDHLTSSCPPASSPQMASPSALGGDAGVIMCVCSRWCAGSGQARTTWCEVTDTF